MINSIKKAISRREKMFKFTNALRLVNGAGDNVAGLLIDCYYRHLQIQMLDERLLEHTGAIEHALSSIMPVDYLIVKTGRKDKLQKNVLIGSDPQTVIQEHGVPFKVNLDDGLNCGLFLDMRHNRLMVGQSCKDKKVLNCFAYTCAFGVHARAGGAREVINVDISRKTLERGRENYQLNNFIASEGEFVKADALSYLKRAFKKGNCFDMIILDPPVFARHEAKVFQVRRDLPKLIALAVGVLNPAGSLFISSNYSEITHSDLERMLAAGLNGRRVSHIQRVGQDEDFTGTNLFKESYLVGLWVKFL